MSRRKQLSTTHRLVLGPDFANSSRFHSAPFQRQPVNRSTGLHFHCTPLHRLKSPKTGCPGAVSAKAFALTTPPKSVRPLAGPGKPMALRLPASPQATAPVSPGQHKSAQRGPAPQTTANSLVQLRAGSRPPQLHRPPAGQPQGSNQAIQGRCDQPSKEGLHAKARLSPRIALTTAGKRRTLTRYAESVAKGTK
jgi:hypothetical protein